MPIAESASPFEDLRRLERGTGNFEGDRHLQMSLLPFSMSRVLFRSYVQSCSVAAPVSVPSLELRVLYLMY